MVPFTSIIAVHFDLITVKARLRLFSNNLAETFLFDSLQLKMEVAEAIDGAVLLFVVARARVKVYGLNFMKLMSQLKMTKRVKWMDLPSQSGVYNVIKRFLKEI